MHTFIALEVAHAIIRSLRQPLSDLARHYAALADQARRAATSVALNTAEGGRRVGKDRTHFFRIAAGSAAELQSALSIATAWGHLSDDAMNEPLRFLDRELGLLFGLQRKRA